MQHFLIYNHELLSIPNSIRLNNYYSFHCDDSEYKSYSFENTTYYIIGDLISDYNQLNSLQINSIKYLKGNFYLIILKEDNIQIITSMFSVLPVYYSTSFNLISSSLNKIQLHSKQNLTLNKKFVLECLLFNYGFFNRTLYNEIALLQSNSLIEISNQSYNIIKHTNITELFSTSFNTASNQAASISDLFIKTSKTYYPDKTFHIAFTSGFDGRTLVSCALFFKKQFQTFSFGKRGNADVDVPEKNAQTLQIPYTFYNLGSENYINNYYEENAINYIKQSNGGNGFIYAHFLHSTIEISKESNYLLAGYAGSELFRALHIPGAVSSPALVKLFNSDSEEEIKSEILNSYALKYLHKNKFDKELIELIEEIINYKKNIPNNLTKNQKLYFFVFEEIIRKLFGQWISLQQNHINVRTPFIDYLLMQTILKTKFAGANTDFMTQNPYKRMSGQKIYASIIKKTNKKIYRQKTGKGYRPIDILNKLNLPFIIIPFILKRFKRKTIKENLDNLSIISGVNKLNLDLFCSKSNELFNSQLIKEDVEKIHPLMPEKERDALLMSLSLLIKHEESNCLS